MWDMHGPNSKDTTATSCGYIHIISMYMTRPCSCLDLLEGPRSLNQPPADAQSDSAAGSAVSLMLMILSGQPPKGSKGWSFFYLGKTKLPTNTAAA